MNLYIDREKAPDPLQSLESGPLGPSTSHPSFIIPLISLSNPLTFTLSPIYTVLVL